MKGTFVDSQRASAELPGPGHLGAHTRGQYENSDQGTPSPPRRGSGCLCHAPQWPACLPYSGFNTPLTCRPRPWVCDVSRAEPFQPPAGQVPGPAPPSLGRQAESRHCLLGPCPHPALRRDKVTRPLATLNGPPDQPFFFFNFWLQWVFVAARGLFFSCG